MAEQGVEAKRDEIRKWHVEDRGWKDIGYHLVIDRDGTSAVGRDISRIGAHTQGHNTGTIGICLIGGHGSSENDAFFDNFTKEQDRELRHRIALLKRQFPTINKVSGHNEYAAKACPGFRVQRWFAGESPARETPLKSTTVQATAGAAAAGAGGVATALSKLDPTAQYIVLGFAGVGVLCLLWIMRERLRRWKAGAR